MDNIGNGNEITLKWVYIEYLNMGVSLEISLGYKDIYNIYRYVYIYIMGNVSEFCLGNDDFMMTQGI